MYLFIALTACRDDAPEPTYVHFKLEDGLDRSSANDALWQLGALTAEPLFLRSPEAIAAERAGLLADGAPLPDLSLWYRVAVAPESADRLARDLALAADVATAFVAPEVALAGLAPAASDACPIKTPRYEPYQNYLGPAPAGIDAPAAWIRPGGRGENVWFADIEGGWNTTHEDLPGDRIEHIAGSPKNDRGWIAHGTAVLGEVASRDNGIGMTGIAPDVARIFTASIGGISPAAAIDAAQAKLRPGDVLLIELHAIGPRGRWLPMEYWDDVWDVIRVATARGVTVIEAAGNGGENLDHPDYRGKLDRRLRDSGAILVGAGAPAREGFVDRSRLDFSNYGLRVDVQGWGRRVATLDYGDLQKCTEKGERSYTDQFSGTSSASPIVAGAALLLQSISKAERGHPLSPAQLRTLLTQTGSPQVDGPHGSTQQHIGPRPNLARALLPGEGSFPERALTQKVLLPGEGSFPERALTQKALAGHEGGF